MKRKIQNLLVVLFASGSILVAQNNHNNRLHLKSHTKNGISRNFQNTVYRPAIKIEYNSYDSSAGTWTLSDSVFMTYNSVANEIVSKTHSDTGMLTSYDTTEYDNTGRIAKQSWFYWNGVSWDTSFVEIFTYNGQNQLIKDLTKYYSSNMLNSVGLDSMVYNLNNQLVEDIYQNWNDTAWEFSSKSEYFYNSNGQINKLYGYEWNNGWNLTDSITSITWYQWNNDVDNSLFSSGLFYSQGGAPTKDSSFYDVQNNEIKYVEYAYDSTLFLWQLSYLSTNEYNYDNNNNIMEDIGLSYNYGVLSNTYKYVYINYLAFNIAGMDENANKKRIVLYPNPNNGIFKISGELTGVTKIIVFNTMGAKVYETDKMIVDGADEIALPKMIKGMYFVTIKNNNTTYTIKMIVN